MEFIITKSWQFVLADSLEKVLPETEPRPLDRDIPQSIFLDETCSFQVGFKPPESARRENGAVQFSVTGPLAEFVTISCVDLVPCQMPAFPGHDDNYLFDAPGLYPDVLRPVEDGLVDPIVGQWRGAWFDVRVPAGEIDALREAQGAESPSTGSGSGTSGPQTFDLEVTGTSVKGEVLFSQTLPITVIPETLPELDIVNTHWFHADGLADHYGDAVFSDEHWQTIDNFVASAARMNINALLTPIWTPPLDTEVGSRRTPVQLVDVIREGDTYTFGFDRLTRWLQILQRHGIRYVEVAHLFTQWGAKATPAIDGIVDGRETQLFGWDVAATDPSYRQFLEQFLPALQGFLAEHWDAERVFYHISDEPHADQLDTYRAAREVVGDLLEGCRVVDALSDFDFYQNGLVECPIVATNRVKPFLEEKIERLWVYYCVSQNRDVSNRFIAMPGARHLVLGHQLFAHDVGGFLHWGFNFYNAAHSKHRINPFEDTCADSAFPAGDAFIVYPGPGGQVWESTRHRVAAQIFGDHRAMQFLRDRTSREAVIKIINPDGALTYDKYSRDPNHFRSTREQINQAIVAAS